MGLELRDLSKHFTVRTDRGRATVRAVENVNLDIPEGQTIALVGESGCGKTTIAKLVLMLERPTARRRQLRRQEPQRDVAAARSRTIAGRCRRCFRIPTPRSIRA